MTTYCRLCADLKEPDEIVTTITDADNLTEQKLTVCCQWKVKYTKQKLPHDVCTLCLDKLDKCWIFVQNVKLAQHKLEEIFENEIEDDTEPERVDKIAPPKIVEIIFDCTDCSRAFSSRTAFEEHECHTGADTAKNQCDICNEKFKTMRDLRVHFNGLRCGICAQAFCQPSALKAHQDEGCEALIETPDVVDCKPTFVDAEPGVSSHKEDDEDETPLECGIIPKEVETSDDEHMSDVDRNDETENESNNAEISAENGTLQPGPSHSNARNATRTRKSRRKTQQNGNENDEAERIFHCYLCEKKFKKFPLLRDHLIIHTYPHRFKCQYCSSRFRTQRAYTSHQRKHVNYHCDICNKPFSSAFTLKVHKRVHFGSSTKMFGCEPCDHYFVDCSAYYNHAKRRHGLTSAEAKKVVKILQPNGTRKPLICDQCGKDFFSKNRLERHLFVHAQARPFSCDFCPKTFKNKYLLKSHRERHTKEKSVECPECGKKYNHKSYLVKHMRIHSGARRKMFQCEYCDKLVTNSQSLQIHRRKHTGELPYKCEPCNYAAASRTQLMTHRKSMAHKNKMNESVELDSQSQNA